MKIKKLAKVFGIICLITVIILLIAYNIATSSGFITGVILPKISDPDKLAINAKTVSISLLSSSIEIEDLSVKQAGKPLADIPLLKCSYSFWDILSQNYKVNELILENALITITKEKSVAKTEEPETPKDQKTDKAHPSPINLDINNLNIKNLTFNYIDELSPSPTKLCLNSINLSIPKFKTNEESTINADAKINIESGKMISVKNGDLKLHFKTILNSFFKPERINGDIFLDSINGNIDKASLENENVHLKIRSQKENEVIDIKELSISVSPKKPGNTSFTAKGQFSPTTLFTDIAYEINPISSKTLNLIGSFAGGYAFDKTTINGKGHITFKNSSLINSNTNIKINNFSLKTATYRLPSTNTWNINITNHSSVDLTAKKADIKILKSTIIEKTKELFSFEVSKPSTISWQDPKNTPYQDLSIITKLNKFNLKDINIFLPKTANTKIHNGTLSVLLQAITTSKDEKIILDNKLDLENLTLSTQGKKYNNLYLKHKLLADIKQLNKILLKTLTLQLKQKQADIADLHLQGTYALKKQQGTAQLNLNVINQQLQQFLPKKQVIENSLKTISPGVTNLNLNSTFNLKAKNATLNTALLKLTQANTEKLKLTQNKALPMTWANGFDWQNLALDYSLIIKDFALPLANAFIPPTANFKITSGKLNSNLHFINRKLPESYITKGNIAIKDLCYLNKGKKFQTFAADLNFDIDKADSKIDFKKVVTNFFENNLKLANAKLIGNLYIPYEKGKSNLILTSNKMLLKRLEKAFKGEEIAPKGEIDKPADKPTPPQKAPKKEPKQPAKSPIDKMHLITRLDLKNIRYGKEIKAILKGKVSIIKNIITTKPLTLTLNKNPISIDSLFNMQNPKLYQYKLGTAFKNLDLTGLLKTFLKGDHQNTKGKIDKFNLNIQGKGFKQDEIDRYLTGKMTAKLSDISIPYSTKNKDMLYLRLIFIPIEVLSKLKYLIPSFDMPKRLDKAITKMTAEDNSLDFDSGDIDININKGRIFVNKTLFTGDEIEELSLSGDLPFKPENKVNLDTYIAVNEVVVPVSIKGTLKKPKPNYTKVTADFLKKNAKNLLNPKKMKKLFNKDTYKNWFKKDKKDNKSTEPEETKEEKEAKRKKAAKEIKQDAKQFLNTLDQLFNNK